MTQRQCHWKLRPLDILLKIYTRLNSYHRMFYGHAMFIGNLLDPRFIYRFRVDQTVKD